MDLNPLKPLRKLITVEDAAGPSLEDAEPIDDPLLERGGLSVAKMIAPQSFIVNEFDVQVGGEYSRTLWILTFPPNVEDNWLYPLFLWQEVIDVSLFVQPMAVDRVVRNLRHQISRDEAELLHADEQGKSRDYALERRYHDNTMFIQALEEDRTRPFQVSLVVTLRAKTREALDAASDQLERRLSSCAVRRADLRHKSGFISTLPFLENRIADAYAVTNMQTEGVQTMFPFTSSDISHPSGVLLGVNMITKSNVIVDRFMQPHITNPGQVILGTSGSGKSYTAKMEMLRWHVLHGVPVIVIDPQHEYDRLCAGVGGQFIDVSPDSPDKINPLDFSHEVTPGHNALQRKMGFAIGMVEVLLRAGSKERPPLTDYQRAILDKALRAIYRRHGYDIRSAQSQQLATAENMPLLSDLYDALDSMARQSKEELFQAQITPLLVGLGPYVADGPYAGLFDAPTTVNLASGFIVFNIARLDDNLLPMGMYLVLEYLRTSLFTHTQQTSGQRRLLYVDEAHRLMDYPETAAFLQWVTRTARKFNVGITVMTQNVEGFLLDDHGNENKLGRTILANCATTIMLKQHANSQELLQQVFKLSPAEAVHLSSFASGEGLLICEDERCWVSMADLASPLEHAMFTTTAREVAELTRGAENPLQIGAGAD